MDRVVDSITCPFELLNGKLVFAIENIVFVVPGLEGSMYPYVVSNIATRDHALRMNAHKFYFMDQEMWSMCLKDPRFVVVLMEPKMDVMFGRYTSASYKRIILSKQ